MVSACDCGKDVFSKGKCHSCYIREYNQRLKKYRNENMKLNRLEPEENGYFEGEN